MESESESDDRGSLSPKRKNFGKKVVNTMYTNKSNGKEDNRTLTPKETPMNS